LQRLANELVDRLPAGKLKIDASSAGRLDDMRVVDKLLLGHPLHEALPDRENVGTAGGVRIDDHGGPAIVAVLRRSAAAELRDQSRMLSARW